MTRFRGYDDFLWSDAVPSDSQALTSSSRPKILRLQFDRRPMRRAVGGVVPGVAIAIEGLGRGDAFRPDPPFHRREPMPVIGLAGIGIAGGPRAPDFIGKRCSPFVPPEQSARLH